MKPPLNNIVTFTGLPKAIASRWPGRAEASLNLEKFIVYVECDTSVLQDICNWLFAELNYSFATLIVQEATDAPEGLPQEHSESWSLRYIFYGDLGSGQVYVLIRPPKSQTAIPSIAAQVHAADWHEREVEDLWGLHFKGHPRLGDFVLHEEWPEGVNPMRADFDASRPYSHREVEPEWQPIAIVQTPGSFLMPIGPVYSDYSESAHFLLETIGEDVVRTIPRLFYKYRGVEKIAEKRFVGDVLLLAERFSGTSAFAHSLAFCQAVEEICGVDAPVRAKALRVFLAELERFRHHVGAIGGICSSTGLVVATSQASILEEELLRMSCEYTGHRYLFGLNIPGGLSIDLDDEACRSLNGAIQNLLRKLRNLQEMLRFSSSFLDRLEEVGVVSRERGLSYGLVGPVARASGVSRDLRKVLPYAYYGAGVKFDTPCEQEGDGYARLRVLFREAEQSAQIINQVASSLPDGEVCSPQFNMRAGAALGWAEAPRGAAFHWVSIGDDHRVARYRLTTPSFTNWHGFHLAAENFAFQDFPIIMATFGLSNAECDR